MNLLAIETSSRVGAVALLRDAGVTERLIEASREQGQRLLPVIDALLADAGLDLAALDAVAFGRGPGSFTGVRLAAAFAQGFGLARGLPLIAVSSLAATAQRAWRQHGVEEALVCVDARMGEVYWGRFVVTAGLAAAVGDEQLGTPDRVTAPPQSGFSAVGDGFAAQPDALAGVREAARQVLDTLTPGAQDVAALALRELAARRFVRPEEALPVYLREQDAWGEG